MNQKLLEILIRESLIPLLPAGTLVIPSYQPTGQGISEGIYFHRVANPTYGWPARKYRHVSDAVDYKQWHRTSYQFAAYIHDNVSNNAQELAEDLLSHAMLAMQSFKFIDSLRAENVGVARPTGIISTTRVMQDGQYAYTPSFDISFAHQTTVSQEQKSITDWEITTNGH